MKVWSLNFHRLKLENLDQALHWHASHVGSSMAQSLGALFDEATANDGVRESGGATEAATGTCWGATCIFMARNSRLCVEPNSSVLTVDFSTCETASVRK